MRSAEPTPVSKKTSCHLHQLQKIRSSRFSFLMIGTGGNYEIKTLFRLYLLNDSIFIKPLFVRSGLFSD